MSVLYVIGLVLVILYLIFGADEFIWEIIILFRRRSYNNKKIDVVKLKDCPTKMLAVAIAAWHESNVIESMVSNFVDTMEYPVSMYHVFVGVYPNDPETIEAVRHLESRYSNVHMVIDFKDGPTSKAQNINYIIKQIKQFEEDNNIRFASLSVHDSEDVAHPYELQVANYLIETKDAIQFPVFPIVHLPSFKNFFRDITTGTYADEFAENHFNTMVGRYDTGAFVPCAGTGFALSRKTIEQFGDNDVLPENSLTEDYRLSLTLYEMGIQMYYILERIPRILKDGKKHWDFITTRSLFPNTFKAAVKQKTRWIMGISMQSLSAKEIVRTRSLSLAGRYSLYKDIKAKVSNLVVLLGYPVFAYYIVSLFVDLPPVYRQGTIPYYLCFVVTGMMIVWQTYRAISIYNVYGMKSVFFACLLPPLFPIRLIYGNIINLVATIRAYYVYFFVNRKPKKDKEEIDEQKDEAKIAENTMQDSEQASRPNESGEPESAEAADMEPVSQATVPSRPAIKWDKTDHEFLTEKQLSRYRRNLGDALLMRKAITPNELRDALDEAGRQKMRFGRYLITNNIVSEEVILDALGDIQQMLVISSALSDKLDYSIAAKDFDIEHLKTLNALPIIRRNDYCVVAVSVDDSDEVLTELKEKYGIHVVPAYISQNKLTENLNQISARNMPDALSKVYGLCEDGVINFEQFINIANFSARHDENEEEVMLKMGLCC